MPKTTKVIACSCKSDFQDHLYGYGLRLHNWGNKINASGGWRCTVCEKEIRGSADEAQTIAVIQPKTK